MNLFIITISFFVRFNPVNIPRIAFNGFCHLIQIGVGIPSGHRRVRVPRHILHRLRSGLKEGEAQRDALLIYPGSENELYQTRRFDDMIIHINNKDV